MSKSLEEIVRKEFVRSLSRIQVEMMNSCGGSGIEQEDEDRIESEADRLLNVFNSSLAQYKREIREKTKKMYKETEYPGGVIGKRFSSSKELYNDAIDDVLAELEK